MFVMRNWPKNRRFLGLWDNFENHAFFAIFLAFRGRVVVSMTTRFVSRVT